MIKNREPLTFAEANEYIPKNEENPEIASFMKKFVNLTSEEAKEFRKKIEGLDLMKIKTEHVIKIVDLMPENEESLNKIFIDVSLDEDETKKILDIIKEYK